MLRRAAAITWLVVFLAVYLPRVGHGFIRDDIGWILDSRVRALSDLGGVALGGEGFFRPVVAASFAITEPVFGNRPLGYGLTNVALALLTAWAVSRLARRLGMGAGAGVLAAAVWLMNFHGIHWSVLWISGRTSLLATLGALLAAERALAGKFWPSAFWLCMSFFAKEEGLAMGFVIAAWLAILEPKEGPDKTEYLASVVLCVGTYLWLRSMSGALTPFSAPDFYQFTFDGRALARNVLEYADRALTTSALAAVTAVIALGWPRVDQRTARVLISCAVWIAGGYAITLFLPVRSDLYALLPSAGAALAAAAIASAAWTTASSVRRRAVLTAAIVGPLLLSPLYWKRTTRWVELGDLSTRTLTSLARDAESRPDPLELRVADDRSTRANLDAAFGDTLESAFYLWTGRKARISITVLH